MMTLKFGRRSVRVADFAEASKVYSTARDKAGLSGASRWPEGTIFDGGRQVARVSYNARIWEPGDWRPGDAPIYTPPQAGARP